MYKNLTNNICLDREFFPYCPDCPNGPKLQTRFMNLAVYLSLYYLSRFGPHPDEKEHNYAQLNSVVNAAHFKKNTNETKRNSACTTRYINLGRVGTRPVDSDKFLLWRACYEPRSRKSFR